MGAAWSVLPRNGKGKLSRALGICLILHIFVFMDSSLCKALDYPV